MENIYKKVGLSILKIVVLMALAYVFVEMFFATVALQVYIGVFIFVFVTLPTIFWIFFAKKFFAKHPKLVKPWKIYLVFYFLIVILYVSLLAIGDWGANQEEKTQKTIDFINSKKITIDDVLGKNLPPNPDQNLNDSTIAGIDQNNNYIRDDVELAIFAKYPDNAKIREAELQYAQALQLELTQVTSSQTLIPVMQKEDLAFDCLGFSGQDTSLSVATQKESEIDNLVINTDLRKKYHSDIYKKYMTSYASSKSNECDLEIK